MQDSGSQPAVCIGALIAIELIDGVRANTSTNLYFSCLAASTYCL